MAVLSSTRLIKSILIFTHPMNNIWYSQLIYREKLTEAGPTKITRSSRWEILRRWKISTRKEKSWSSFAFSLISSPSWQLIFCRFVRAIHSVCVFSYHNIYKRQLKTRQHFEGSWKSRRHNSSRHKILRALKELRLCVTQHQVAILDLARVDSSSVHQTSQTGLSLG